MKVGDVLLEIDGKPINMIAEFYQAIAGAFGQTLEFTIVREGQTIRTKVTLKGFIKT